MDNFLRLSDRDIIQHAGTVTHEAAQLRAERELSAHKTLSAAEPQAVDADFDAAVNRVNRLPLTRRNPQSKSTKES